MSQTRFIAIHLQYMTDKYIAVNIRTIPALYPWNEYTSTKCCFSIHIAATQNMYGETALTFSIL